MKFVGLFALASAALLGLSGAVAQTPASREAPARPLPVPTTVSPEIQKLIAAPPSPIWNFVAKSKEEWKTFLDTGTANSVKTFPAKTEALRIKYEPRRPSTMLLLAGMWTAAWIQLRATEHALDRCRDPQPPKIPRCGIRAVHRSAGSRTSIG